MPYCRCRRLQILLYPSVQLITLCSSLLASLKNEKKDPIIILGSSFNPREAAHPQCHQCLCYRFKLTNGQAERGASALQDLLYSRGTGARFPALAHVVPSISVTALPHLPSPVHARALFHPSPPFLVPWDLATSKFQERGTGRAAPQPRARSWARTGMLVPFGRKAGGFCWGSASMRAFFLEQGAEFSCLVLPDRS